MICYRFSVKEPGKATSLVFIYPDCNTSIGDNSAWSNGQHNLIRKGLSADKHVACKYSSIYITVLIQFWIEYT